MLSGRSLEIFGVTFLAVRSLSLRSLMQMLSLRSWETLGLTLEEPYANVVCVPQRRYLE